MHSPKSTAAKILRWLKTGHSLTFMQAVERFHTISLRERIRDLKEEGHRIDREMVERNGKRYAKYYLRGAA